MPKEFNPYSPPTASVEEISPLNSSISETPFFPVSIPKFVVLCIFSLGIYQIYWFYQNWKRIKKREHLDIYPFWRSIFAIFFCIQCFGRIRDYPTPEQEEAELSSVPFAISWIVTTLTQRLPDPYSWFSLLAFVFIVPVQIHANHINRINCPNHDPNRRFTAWNWVLIVIGFIILALAFLGLFLPNQA